MDDARTRTRALLAMAVALVATIAFVILFRRALDRMPPATTAAQATARADSARAARNAPGDRPGGRTQPAELPRLR